MRTKATDLNKTTSVFGSRTRWTILDGVKDRNSPQYRDAMIYLAERYRKPIHVFLRRLGFLGEQADDLTQEFFAVWLEKGLFGRADRTRGRFRWFLKVAIRRFALNELRKRKTKRRNPEGGVGSWENLRSDDEDGISFEPSHDNTPEREFDLTLDLEIAQRALASFEEECRKDGMEAHAYVFRKELADPILKRAAVPDRAETAAELKLSAKQVSNRLTIARKKYQSHLRNEVRAYAETDEEIAEEVRRIFRLFSGE